MKFVVKVKNDKGGEPMDIHVDAASERDAIEDVKGRGWKPLKAEAIPVTALPVEFPSVVPEYQGINVLSGVMTAIAVLGYMSAAAAIITGIVTLNASGVASAMSVAVVSVVCHGAAHALLAIRDIAINSFRR